MWILLYDWHSFRNFVHVLWFCGIWLDWSSVAYVTIWMYNKLQITIPERNSRGEKSKLNPIHTNLNHIQTNIQYTSNKKVQSLTLTFQFYLIWSDYQLVSRKLPSPNTNVCRSTHSPSTKNHNLSSTEDLITAMVHANYRYISRIIHSLLNSAYEASHKYSR